jgi:hypothetical protein
MNFDLNDVAATSSDSSSSSSSLSSHRHHAASAVSASRRKMTTTTIRVNDVDENLAYELRSALHLAIGKICRAEDMVSSSSSSLPDNDDTKAADSLPTIPTTKKIFKMNNESIIALTDLTYHFITTCYANDLVAFSHHAKRKQVKLEDVLLVARKDEVGALAELHRVIADNPSMYGSTSTTNVGGGKQKKNGGGTITKKRKDTATAAAAAVKERSRPTSSKNNKRQSKLLSTSALLKKGRKKCLSSSSSSSSSSGESDDDEDDDDDSSIDHNYGLKMRRRKLELERQSLTNIAQQQKHKQKRRNVGLSDDDMNSDNSIHDFIAKEDDDNDDDEEIDFSAIGEAGVKTRKMNDDDSNDNESTDNNYLDSAGIGDGGKKNLDDCSMIIDLCEE